MDNKIGLAGALGMGAGLMYLLDPASSRRRRALVRDKAVHGRHVAGRAFGVAARDFFNRSRGVLAETRATLKSESVSDAVLQDRVRARLGRLVTHPHAVHVDCQDGVAILSGPVLAHELTPLLEGVREVRGVHELVSRLEAHGPGTKHPSLQGPGHPRGTRRFGLLSVPPGAWFLVGIGIFGLSGLLTSWLASRRLERMSEADIADVGLVLPPGEPQPRESIG